MDEYWDQLGVKCSINWVSHSVLRIRYGKSYYNSFEKYNKSFNKDFKWDKSEMLTSELWVFQIRCQQVNYEFPSLG